MFGGLRTATHVLTAHTRAALNSPNLYRNISSARPLHAHFSSATHRPSHVLQRLEILGRQRRSFNAILGSRSPLLLGIEPRFFSANRSAHANEQAHPLPTLSPPSVGRWLLLSSALVFGIIVVGGVTRLTESGLSISEWRPITGILPPLSQAQWDEEFRKYQATPEFKILNHSMTLDDFKRIFYMEWAHRVMGRVVGVAFVLPLAYFAFTRKLTRGLTTRLSAMALLIGFQGFLGWYMVQSGLSEDLLDQPGAVPRVSQYRLAAHLGTAVVLYGAMLSTGLAVLRDWKFAIQGKWSGLLAKDLEPVLKNPIVRKFRRRAWLLTSLVFLTAMSGAFVAGLDAGLVYNEFPLMGGRLAPPTDELMNPAYAKQADKSDLWWRNLLENPSTVQFDHRVLAVTTYLSTGLLYTSTLAPAMRAALPALTRRLAVTAFALANVQVALGITTLLYLVPVPLAAAHQAGSIALLSSMIALCLSLRAPGGATKLWRQAITAKRKP
ncbi:COX15-CtaA-domain-containing protein [Rickenella mellea]|uniref:COX15-CtaA-domain-containing protein n=1 Tax=Rickenella mellea TaxID=50990 RepID=A0A4R5XF41_9AGAM|nr:COX15-CtaA-domain-containing protein [Rickenella mellea]